MDIEDPNTPTPLPPLNEELVLTLWSRTYNTSGKPDWSHIFPYYTHYIIFQDPIQRAVGKTACVARCKKMTKRCQELKMDITSIASGENLIFMQWTMTMVFRKTPSTPIYGCTKLSLNSAGLIMQQRDYYDLWGDIFANVPGMKRAYPRFMRKHFG